MRARHLAPLALVVAILIAPWTAAVYVAANLAASAQVAWAERSWRYLLQMPVAFASLHLPYGAGSLWGVLRVLGTRLGREDSMSAGRAAMAPDFSSVTEQPWQGATRTQMSMLRTRYGWAAEHAAGKDVLEVACGAGSAWDGSLKRRGAWRRGHRAGKLPYCAETYRGQANIRVEKMDALDLPFGAAASMWRSCSKRCITCPMSRGSWPRRGVCCGLMAGC